MSRFMIVMIIIVAVLLAATIFLYFWGKRIQKKQEEQNELVQKNIQPISMLIIDKKRLPVKKSGLPEEMINQLPFYLRFSKMPIIKAKVGPRMMTFMCDPAIFDIIPLKKEVKANVSGIYISSVRGLHGRIDTSKQKIGLLTRLSRFVKNG